VSQSDGMFLVRATLELQDGSRHPGFVTPAFKEGDLGVQQPQIFVGKRRFGFWGGMFGVAEEERQALYTRLGEARTRFFRCGSTSIPVSRQVQQPVESTASIGVHAMSKSSISRGPLRPATHRFD